MGWVDGNVFQVVFCSLELQKISHEGNFTVGLGCELLNHIFDVAQPQLAMKLSADRGSFTVSVFFFCQNLIRLSYDVHHILT